MSVVVFLITLSVLVFVHEFGHFLAAKKSGVSVEEFGFGLPPRLFGRKVGGTLYSINLLPIGGFVKLKGEDESEVLGFGDSGSFSKVAHRSRFLIVVAGVLGNLLLAYFILTLLFLVGYPKISGAVIIDGVAKNSPAEAVGIQPSDRVVSVNGVKIDNPETMINRVNGFKGHLITLGILRNGSTIFKEITPRASPPKGEGALGVRLGFEGGLVYEKDSLWLAPVRGGQELINGIGQIFVGLGTLVSQIFVGRVPQDVAGPVGIYKLTSEAYAVGLRVFLQFVALISLNLFVFNLLPIPALDGGRLVFIVWEAFTRRKVNPRAAALINNVGLALLLTLFVLVTIRDIRRF
ncbi:MAG: M50 family metallopeptidase [Patescibacteria group bacterium]|nr:M50 family metallopeptidase [Patescibacteria group bacterium]